MGAAPARPRMPFGQQTATEIAPRLRALQAAGRISRVTTPVGDDAWLVTRYDDVRALLSDERLGMSHPDPANAPRVSGSPFGGGPSWRYETEAEDHTKVREMLVPHFTTGRIQSLRPAVERLVDSLLEDVAAAGPPCDLHEAVAVRLPFLVMCELLGVPERDRAALASRVRTVEDGDARRAADALSQTQTYLHRLVAFRRRHPGDDLVSRLGADNPSEDAGYLAALAAMVLFAGQAGTVVSIDYGILLVAADPDASAALAADPDRAPAAVEEILRCSLHGGGVLPRYARSRVEIAGAVVEPGELVLLANDAANRDERAFERPDRFDIGRTPNAHVAFGHGLRHCVGARLARLELRVLFERLPRRLPGLRLAAPPDEIAIRTDAPAGGLRTLPVAWTTRTTRTEEPPH